MWSCCAWMNDSHTSCMWNAVEKDFACPVPLQPCILMFQFMLLRMFWETFVLCSVYHLFCRPNVKVDICWICFVWSAQFVENIDLCFGVFLLAQLSVKGWSFSAAPAAYRSQCLCIDDWARRHTHTYMHDGTCPSDSIKVKNSTARVMHGSTGQNQPCVFLLEKCKAKVEESWVQLWKALMGFFRALQDNNLFSSPTV